MTSGPRTRRFLAALVDLAVAVLVIFFAAVLAGGLERGLDRLKVPGAVSRAIGSTLMLGAHAAYYILATALAGTTAGKLLLGLRVVDAAGGRPSLGTATIRYAGQWASNLLLGLGHFLYLFRADRRSLQDLLAGTQVLGRQDAAAPAGGGWTAPGPLSTGARVGAFAAAGFALWVGVKMLDSFRQLQQYTWEAGTKGNLSALRSAISIYYGDTEGLYPDSLSTAPDSPFSRYIEKIPMVTANHAGIGRGTLESPRGNMITYTVNETITITGQGWRYNPKNGHLYVNSCATDAKGLPYSCYGY